MKKRAPSLLLALLALAGLLTAGGCSLGRSPRPDFYMLSSPVENVVQSGKEKISGPRVAIGPVSIPGYLDRPQLFLRDGNDVKVELAEFNHWSEPFGEGVTRVLCDAVSASLTPRKGLASPMRSQQPFQWRIAVDIARFDGAPNGSVILDAGWSLVNESGEELKSGRFVQHAPAGPDIPSLVQAQSALLAQFGAVLGKMIPLVNFGGGDLSGERSPPPHPSSLPPKTFDLIESPMTAFPFYRECRLFLEKLFLLQRQGRHTRLAPLQFIV